MIWSSTKRGFYIELRGALREQVERGPIAAARFPRSSRQYRLYARLFRQQAYDARALEVVEGMKHYRFRDEERHACEFNALI